MPDFYAKMINKEPMIVIGGNGNGLLGPARAIGRRLPAKQRVLYLINFWQALDYTSAKNIGYELRDWKAAYPDQHFLFLANDLLQLEYLKRAGIPSILGNHNLFVSEKTYQVDQAHPERKFDAIYNGRMSPMKRHELCSQLQSVAFLYYFMPARVYERYDRVREMVPQATYLNGDPHEGKYRHFDKKQCVYWYNRSRVGLCLSASEGAMLSSMEYLMCGVPVLTTKNLGGRSHFFRPEFSVEVDADPTSIAKGVEMLVARNLDPDEVRADALRIVHYERARFFEQIQRHLQALGMECDFEAAFNRGFADKMWETYKEPEAFFTGNGLEMVVA